jgi:glycosyltransferase involved in cell wall biosynthesis
MVRTGTRGRDGVCIDATVVTPLGKGAALYAREVLRAMHAAAAERHVVVLARSHAAAAVAEVCPSWRVHPVTVGSTVAWHLRELPALRRSLGARVLHVLGEFPVGTSAEPYTMAVHELPVVRRRLVAPKMSLGERLAVPVIDRLLRRSARQAAGLLALSESTARDLAREFGIRPDRITVAYPGVDRAFFDAGVSDRAAPSGVPSSYVLTFATGDTRENAIGAVDAFIDVASTVPHSLVIAGRCPSALRASLEKRVDGTPAADRLHFTGFVADDMLPALYAGCDAFVELTRYEGFGLQVAEAMAAGAVVVASGIPAIREVVGDAGLLVDDSRPGAVSSALARSLGDEALRGRLRVEAPARARRFTWAECAALTWRTIDGAAA